MSPQPIRRRLPLARRRSNVTRRLHRIEVLETRALLAAGFVELGPSDNIALDQPRVAVEFAKDIDPGPGVQWESIGPGLFNTFLLDTGASSVLTMGSAIADIEQTRLGYEVQGALLETGVAGDHLLDVSIPYRFDFAGSNGVRHTLTDARVMSDATKDFSSFGPWGLVGMPAMEGRVTSLDFSGWSGGGVDLDSIYMNTEFRDDVPAGNGHRYTVSADNRLAFDPLDQMVFGQPPIWGDVPFVTGIPEHHGIAQEGNFLFDTGAQISVISEQLAIAIGLDSNGDGQLDQRDENYVTQQVVGGVGGQVSVPVFGFDEFRLPTDSGVELVWTNLEWLVLDISVPGQDISLDGVFGSDLLTSGWFHAFFYPGQPDGYVNQMHMDFREMETNGTGKIHFDLNPAVDNLTLPGPGIIIRQSFRTTDVGEGAATDSYSVVLTGAPTADVIVTFANADGQVTAENAADGTDRLVFTPQNWETPQSILVTAVNDLAAEGNHSTFITHTVTSADPGYDGMAVPDVKVRITDDDLNLLKITSDAAGQNPIQSLPADEGGADVFYWVALTQQPPNEYWVQLEDSSGQTEAIKADNPQLGLENVLMFHSGNWSQPQRVRLSAIDDTIKEGPHQARMVHTVLDVVNFADPIIGQTPLIVSITDDDLAHFIVTPSDGSTKISESGITDTYQIAPNLAPTGAVEVTVTADRQTRISIDGGLTFADTQVLHFNDAVPQTVTVAAIDDNIAEETHFGTISHQITGTVIDPRFSSDLSIESVTATITDNDSAGVTLSPGGSGGTNGAGTGPGEGEASGTTSNITIRVSESGQDGSYWVALKSQPVSEVTIFLNSPDDQTRAVAANDATRAYLTFDANSWATPQQVRVVAKNDSAVEGFQTTSINHQIFSTDIHYRGSVLLPVEVTDNDVPGFSVSKLSASVSEDGAITDSISIALDGQPLSDVVIGIETSDPQEMVADRIELTFTPETWNVLQTVQLSGVSDGRIDGTQLVPLTIGVVDEKSFDLFDSVTDVTVDVKVIDEAADYGDAPRADQSGFGSDYPVTLAQDGARHRISSLYLGSSVDSEADGQSDLHAGRDGSGGDDSVGADDEDGVALAAMVTDHNLATTSSVTVVASGLGKLDAWIDFNHDGDWHDANEQILVSAEVIAGRNLLSFNVPAGAASGDTAARFRISSAGFLAPTGEAADGEVEDHWVTIFAGHNQPAVSLNLVDNLANVALGTSRVQVQSGQVGLFAAPTVSIGSLALTGTASNDAWTISLERSSSIPEGGLRLDGLGGDNTLLVAGDGGYVDLSEPRLQFTNFAWMDLSAGHATTLVLDASSIASMSPDQRRIGVRVTEGDRIILSPEQPWRLGDPVSRSGSFLITANNAAAGGDAVVEVDWPHPWQNWIRSSDVDNDGESTAGDALRIINELASRRYSDRQTQVLADPRTLPLWPGVYFDQNGDDQVSALDALRVINDLARLTTDNGGGEGEWIAASFFVPTRWMIDRADPDDSTDEISDSLSNAGKLTSVNSSDLARPSLPAWTTFTSSSRPEATELVPMAVDLVLSDRE